jgi:hypothetical protein
VTAAIRGQLQLFEGGAGAAPAGASPAAPGASESFADFV